MDRLSAISIRQPWLDMIVRGFKVMELRTWEMRERGTIALHAPKRIDFGAAYLYGYSQPWLLPTGKIVAVADVMDVLVLDRKSWCETLAEHRQPIPTGGVYGIRLSNVRPLKRPIVYRGRQVIFPLNEDVVARVRKALSECA
jgi:hypothetical protein